MLGCEGGHIGRAQLRHLLCAEALQLFGCKRPDVVRAQGVQSNGYEQLEVVGLQDCCLRRGEGSGRGCAQGCGLSHAQASDLIPSQRLEVVPTQRYDLRVRQGGHIRCLQPCHLAGCELIEVRRSQFDHLIGAQARYLR